MSSLTWANLAAARYDNANITPTAAQLHEMYKPQLQESFSTFLGDVGRITNCDDEDGIYSILEVLMKDARRARRTEYITPNVGSTLASHVFAERARDRDEHRTPHVEYASTIAPSMLEKSPMPYDRTDDDTLHRKVTGYVNVIDGVASGPTSHGELDIHFANQFSRQQLEELSERRISSSTSHMDSLIDPALQPPSSCTNEYTGDPSPHRTMGPPSSLTAPSGQSRRVWPRGSRTVISEPIRERDEIVSLVGSASASDRTCALCSRKFPFPRDLRAHIVAKHNEKRLPCDQCDQSLASEFSLKRHKASKHNNGYPCEACDKVFGTQTALDKHNASEHRLGYYCQRCKRFFSQQAKHNAEEHQEGHVCSGCKKCFASANSLRHHRKGCPNGSHGQPRRPRSHNGQTSSSHEYVEYVGHHENMGSLGDPHSSQALQGPHAHGYPGSQ
ncbi:hypothetical protein FN846DRAFT_469668 [Sphaerosporella brunnea]|uniref:C2H2-type domain-containing protein n=1 Tax=Sphaerosporella brunnea TaxID=1250544 RepID=A0A5J5EF65_9PEZI|nr:hypothetical protein FN846DRAFT_469668 [Sphaerosporella brunnea]